MKETPTRRSFMKYAAAGAAILVLPQGFSSGQDTSAHPPVVKRAKPPALPPDLAKQFVIAAHSDLAKTKELLGQEPGLLNASWDWGGGDFEMGIEGAGHVGSKDVANFLISKGARLTIFVAVMLGKMDIVKPILTTFPDMIHSKGPHGLGFIHHAQKGGDEALPVLEYLKSLGAK